MKIRGCKIVHIEKSWPEGLSDGLILPCAMCGKNTALDYHVEDEFWKRTIPEEYDRDVVCLACLVDLSKPDELENAMRHVQFVINGGITVTCESPTIWKYGEIENSDDED